MLTNRSTLIKQVGAAMISCIVGLSIIPAFNSAGAAPQLTIPDMNYFPRIRTDLLINSITNKGNVSLVWSAPYPELISPLGAPAVGSDGTVYLGLNYFIYVGFQGVLSASTQDGKKKWDYSPPSPLLSPPTVGPDGTIYIGAGSSKYNEGDFIAILPDGTPKWSVSLGPVSSKPVFGTDGTVYAAANDGMLYALDPADGTKKWFSKVGHTTTAYMSIGQDGTIYAGNESETFYAIKPNGSIKWTFKAGGMVNTVPVIGTDGTIYIGAGDGKLYALNSNGSKQWEYGLKGIPTSPVIGNDGTTVYFGAADSTVYALHSNGTLKWKTGFGKAITQVVKGTNGTLHFLTADGMVQALNPDDGSLQWRYVLNTPDGINVPAVSEDGSVYAIGMKKTQLTLYALRVKVSDIALNVPKLTLQVGKSDALSVSLSPENAPNRKVTWSSSKSGVASVDSEGKVTAISAGTAIITAISDDSGLSVSCEVTVSTTPDTVEVESIKIDRAELTVKEGGVGKLTATVLPVNASNQKVAWRSSDPGIARVNESGQVTGMTPGTAMVTAAAEDGGFTASSKVTVQPDTEKPETEEFTDIEGHWAKGEIARAFELQIVNGYPDFTFRPDGNVTRAEFVVMLMNALKPGVQGSELVFQDNDSIQPWAERSISQAVQLGIVNGYSDGTFRPDANITHAEMATMVFKASGMPLPADPSTDYSDDADIPEWARDAVSAAEKNGIIVVGGRSTGAFAPQQLSIRAEAAVWIVKMMDIRNKK
ncbi:S-layer homology domain-containing protein [Paenibacillus sp. NPDC056579]|uniref:S-layer homology domain-containing protein n=1 Tax=Paenibacillus sp. NPDC056579 TaxID=3345871 RepID=UPI0036BCA7DF